MGNVKINSIKLKNALEDSPISVSKLSSMVLNRGTSYISGCIRDSSMGEEDLNTLCRFLNLKPADYILTEHTESNHLTNKKTEKEQKNTSETIDYNSKLDTLIVGLNVMYEEQSKTNKLLQQLIEMMSNNGNKIENIEQRIKSIDNSSGQTLAKITEMKEYEEEIADSIIKLKSSVNTVSGRTNDILRKIAPVPRTNIKAVK